MKQVLIAYKSLPAYRVEFFNELRDSLDAQGVRLRLAYGNPFGSERLKADSVDLPWADFRPNRFLSVRTSHAIWQPIGDLANQSDLVIVEQASRLLVNYWLLLRRAARIGAPVALWGHGANLQVHTAKAWSENLKKRYSRLPDWWFAYTEGSRDRVAELGYPRDRITVVQNAVDTQALRRSINNISDRQLDEFLSEHGATPGRIGLFIGSLYEDKRLDFLIESYDHIRRLMPDFVLLIAGDGPSRPSLEAAITERPGIRYLGRVDGEQRALALHASDVVLMPGLVGLGILDAFASGSPLITTDVNFHSPEIEYLRPGENGSILPDPQDVKSYGNHVVGLLRDVSRLERMKAACLTDSDRFTTANMVERFTQGVLSALEAPVGASVQ